MKKYKAYPGLIGYVFLFPLLLMYLISGFVILKTLSAGETNTTIIVYAFIGVLFATVLWRLFWSMITQTVLILTHEGLVYSDVKFHPWNIFKTRQNEIKVPWNGIRQVSWVGATNGPLSIKTDAGDIRFWVIFRDRTNAEIMREILSRVPHVKGPVDEK